MNKFQRRVKKMDAYLRGCLALNGNTVSDRRIKKDARNAVRGVIRNFNPNFLNEKW